MDIKGQISTQDDIKVKLEISLTVGEIRAIVNDIDDGRYSGTTGRFLDKLKSISGQVKTVFFDDIHGGE